MTGSREQSAPVATQGSGRSTARRQAILAAATEVFSARGYDGASIREISERVGITKGNLTYHFAVKDDLLIEIIDEVHAGFLRQADEWSNLRSDDPEEVLRAAFREHVLQVAATRDAVRISYEAFRHLSEAQQVDILHKRDRYELAVRRLIARCHPELGSARSRRNALQARTVLGMINWPYQWYDPAGSVSPGELADLVADMAVKALRT